MASNATDIQFRRPKRQVIKRKRARSPTADTLHSADGLPSSAMVASAGGDADASGLVNPRKIRPAHGKLTRHVVRDGPARTSWRHENVSNVDGASVTAAVEATLAQDKRVLCHPGDTGGAPAVSKRPVPNGAKSLRAPTNVRVSVQFDYQPDVCKDYKETGYCGFGDSCKFLHDRGDYKAGWQLDRDWEAKHGGAGGTAPVDDYVDQDEQNDELVDEDGLPFACFICRCAFQQPVVTLCKHYFCEECALRRMASDSKCAVCAKQLRGVLNAAPKLVAKLEARAKVVAGNMPNL